MKFENAKTVNCAKAEQDLRLTPDQCAFLGWYETFELNRLYDMIFGSYWTVLGIVLPIVLWYMYLCSVQVREARSEDRLYKQQTKLMEFIGNPIRKLKRLESKPKRLTEFEYEYEYDDSLMMEIN